jgi:hypothetical protein
MGFSEDVYRLATQITSRKNHCRGNEEATKHSLILPFFQTLGYDIYDPAVLMPEYRAGFASNKEKIDYAIFLNGVPALFIEAKAVGDKLENHDAQLAKYFNSTPGLKVAVITNGLRYKFFTDLKQPNLLDSDPFFEFDIESIGQEEVDILKGFRSETFNPTELVLQAENLVYLNAIKRKFRTIFRDPSDEFVRFIASDIFPKKITANALDRLNPLVRQAMSSVLVEMVSNGLTQAITVPVDSEVLSSLENKPYSQAPNETENKDKATPVTTEIELDGFRIVQNITGKDGSPDPRVGYKDTVTYMGIHIGGPHRWFVRLFFNGSQKYIVVRVPASTARDMTPHPLSAEEITNQPDVSRINIDSPSELENLKTLITYAYQVTQANVPT